MNRVAIAASSAFLLILAAAQAQGWEPFSFSGDERYEYRVSVAGDVDTVYILDIRSEGEVDGEEQFRVSTTTSQLVPAAELGAETAFGTGFGMTLNMAIMNPMFMMFIGPIFADLEWEVGERMSLMGMGRISITGMETVAGREGFVVQFETGTGDERELAAEWVIDPDLALPLRSRNYDRGELSMESVLVDYQTH